MSTALLSLQRFEDYYLTGGDLYCIAENKIFRVHRYFFERESTYFKAELAQPVTPGAQRLGGSEDSAILLEGVRSDAFAKLLWVFYNPKYSLYDATVEDWSTILELAEKWGFAEVKNLCIRHLEKLEMLDVDRIVLYHTFNVDEKHLVPRYVALAERPELLTVEEGLQLGMQTVIALTRARECARNGASSGLRSPSPGTLSEKDLTEIIIDHFNIKEDEPAKPAGAFRPNSLPPLRALTAELQENHRARPTILVQCLASPLARNQSPLESPAIAVPAPGTRHLQELQLALSQTPQTPRQPTVFTVQAPTKRRIRRVERNPRIEDEESESEDSDREDSGYESETVKAATFFWEDGAEVDEEFTNSYEQVKFDADAIDQNRPQLTGVEDAAILPPVPPTRLLFVEVAGSYMPSDNEEDDEFFDSAEDPSDELVAFT
ncbi:hypothetical protein C8F01DRAFT_1105354 [Mycena amicta]|nr:hypothetical protein C8F01DRAFT_1105354 [Mycena amicta]